MRASGAKWSDAATKRSAKWQLDAPAVPEL